MKVLELPEIERPPYIDVNPHLLLNSYLESYFFKFEIITNMELFQDAEADFCLLVDKDKTESVASLVLKVQRKYFKDSHIRRVVIHSYKWKQYYIVRQSEL
jgi:hypothetical protein